MRRLLGWPGHGWLAVPMRWYLGGLFFLACLHKIADPGVFALDIATYDVLPLALVNLMAVILPWIELVAALQLLLGLRVRPAALLVSAMMVMFLVALAIALGRGLDMSCGCFASQGAEEDPISAATVMRDSVWLAMSLYVVAWDRSLVGLDRLLHRRVG
jgi:uncharacterized membrane protein YphA (DoxX/SURF4 family)